MGRRTGDSRPVMVGFELLEGMAERAGGGASDGYPPFNLEARADGAYALVLAVAGFTAEEIEILLEGEDLLSVAGRAAPEESEREFLHRGIAKRRFRRVFALAPGLEVSGASLDCGLLRIVLKKRPGASGVRKIVIDPTS